MSGPMDPELLAEMRADVDDWSRSSQCQLLADRDFWEAETRTELLRRQRLQGLVNEARAEVKRYRSRCPVTAEDVEAAGVTPGQARAWAFSVGFRRPCWWKPSHDVRLGEEHDDWFVHPKDSVDEGVMGCHQTLGQRVADLANWATAYVDPCPLDILDEMAAMDTGAEVGQ